MLSQMVKVANSKPLPVPLYLCASSERTSHSASEGGLFQKEFTSFSMTSSVEQLDKEINATQSLALRIELI